MHAQVEAADRSDVEAVEAKQAQHDARAEDAIWTLPRRSLFFACADRPTAKALAADIADGTLVMDAVARAKQL